MANPVYFGVEALVLAVLAKPWRSVGEDHSEQLEQESASRVTV
jgi:hypothetical protein